MEKVTLDLTNENVKFISTYVREGEKVHQISFENTVIILNEEQMNRLRD